MRSVVFKFQTSKAEKGNMQQTKVLRQWQLQHKNDKVDYDSMSDYNHRYSKWKNFY